MANKYSQEKHEFIERMFVSLDQVPVESIVGRYVKLTERGRHRKGLCPFHNDTKLGSFIVTPDKKIWKCFTCGDDFGGNGIKFVALFKGITYLEAAFDTALQFGIITYEEYEKYSKKKYNDDFVKKMERRFSEERLKEEEQPKKASREIIHQVYQTMKDVSVLSDEHKKQLREKRKLSDERIDRDYFSCPTHWKVKDNVIKVIKEKYEWATDDILKTVPGFFYDKKHQKITFTGYKGICILIRDVDQKIIGIQIRKDVIKEGECRYIWFSSAFAFYRPEEFSGGCGSGSPKDVLLGSKKCLCITEGRFKSEILNQFGNNVISLQGVTAWYGITEILKVLKRRGVFLKNIYIFLDSDILGKHKLFEQSTKMCNDIKEHIPDAEIQYVFWSMKKGKGIDDYIINTRSIDGLHYLGIEKAKAICSKTYQLALETFGITREQDLDRKKSKEFECFLQSTTEELLFA